MKESAIIMRVFSLVLAYVSVCAGEEWGSVVCLCVEGPGCFPDFSWELQRSISSAENSKSKPPTS